MKQSQLTTLFTGLGIILLVVTLNTWLASQAGRAILNVPLIHDERPAMAFFGLMMCSVLFFLTCLVGFIYAHRSLGCWHERIPPVWLKRLDTKAAESKVFLMVILVIFVGVPFGGLMHFIDIVWNSKLCVLNSKAEPVMVSQGWFFGILNADNQIRLVENLTNGKCDKGVQVFPGWEFSLVWVAVVLSGVMAILFLVEIFHSQLRPAR
jgi:hypothetical protein